MLEITVERFRALEDALDNYIQANITSFSKYSYRGNFVPLVVKSKWRRKYKKNKYSAIIQIIMNRYGSIKLINKNEVIIARKKSEVYKLIHKHSNYKRTEISKHNLII